MVSKFLDVHSVSCGTFNPNIVDSILSLVCLFLIKPKQSFTFAFNHLLFWSVFYLGNHHQDIHYNIFVSISRMVAGITSIIGHIIDGHGWYYQLFFSLVCKNFTIFGPDYGRIRCSLIKNEQIFWNGNPMDN